MAHVNPVSAVSVPEPRPEVEKATVQSKSPRLAALDAFRGFTILTMLLVNNVALDYQTPAQLQHAKWNLGMHVADLVFPWFLLCVGIALPYSRASFTKSGLPRSRYFLKVATRSAALVFLGCLVDSAINHQIAFSLGVLQLIGLAYFVAALAYELPLWGRAVFAATLLLGYGWAILHVSFPGAEAGTFQEDRNLLKHINSAYLAPYRLQGLLSTIPTAALVLLGSLVGDALRQPRDGGRWRNVHKLGVLLVVGVLLVGLGDLASVVLPYNKPVWTPSYILAAGGIGTLAVALFFLVVDVARQRWLAYPFVVFGSNAIVAYVVPILVKVLVLQVWLVPTEKGNVALQKALLDWLKGNYGAVPGGWAYTVLYIAVWWLVLWMLYRRRLFLRV